MSFSRTRTNTRSRTLAAVGFLAATGLFLTACSGSDDPAAASSPSADASAGAPSVLSPSSAAPSATVDDTEATADDSGPTVDATEPGTDATEDAVDNRADGTVTGTLTYLAPGKLEVSGRGFWVAEDTGIQGGDICGDPENQVAEKCTADELDAAAKAGNLTVKVTIKKGIAKRVTQV